MPLAKLAGFGILGFVLLVLLGLEILILLEKYEMWKFMRKRDKKFWAVIRLNERDLSRLTEYCRRTLEDSEYSEMNRGEFMTWCSEEARNTKHSPEDRELLQKLSDNILRGVFSDQLREMPQIVASALNQNNEKK